MKRLLFLLILALGIPAMGSDHADLINGEVAPFSDWPASKYIRSGNSACSATLVGPQALITAAHCVRNGGSVTFSNGSSGYTGRCTHHSEYDYVAWHYVREMLLSGQAQKAEFGELVNATADWAMCKLDREVPLGEVPMYETLLRDPSVVKVGMKVRLTGYGCTKPGGGGGNDGPFRIGFATVTDVPSGKDNDTVTAGGGALCFGDSGGGAYVELAPGVRVYFGTNSRGDIKKYSYLSSVFTATAQKFFADWATKNGVKVCGYSTDTKNCRGLLPPVPPKEFTVVGKTVAVKVVVSEQAKYSVEAAKVATEKLVADLDSLN